MCGSKKPEPEPEPAPAPEPEDPNWTCGCGTVNNGNFCFRCGSRRPDKTAPAPVVEAAPAPAPEPVQPKEPVPIPEPVPEPEAAPEPEDPNWTCGCGTVNNGNFCFRCGSRRPDKTAPAPVVEAAPAPAPEPVQPEEPAPIPEPVPEPEAASEPEFVPEAEPEFEAETVVEEPVAELEPIAEPAPEFEAEPEVIAEPEVGPIPEEEPVPEAEPIIESEAELIPEPEAAEKPEPEATAEPELEPIEGPEDRSLTEVISEVSFTGNIEDAREQAAAVSDDDEGVTQIIFDELADDLVLGWLVAANTEIKGKIFTFTDTRVTIGRSDPEHPVIIDLHGDRAVSRGAQAVIIYDPLNKKFFIQSAGGKTPIYVNRQMLLAPAELAAYDRIMLGETELVFVPLCTERFSW